MRFREFKVSEDFNQPAPVTTSTVAPTTMPPAVTTTATTTPVMSVPPKQTIGQEPAPVQTKSYANKKQIDELIDFLELKNPAGTYSYAKIKDTKRVEHLRLRKLSPAELDKLMTAFGATKEVPDSNQQTVSGLYPAYSYKKNDIVYTIVIATKGSVSKKELTPSKLGLREKFTSKQQLITSTIAAITKNFGKTDPALNDALIALVQSAEAGGKDPLPEDVMETIRTNIQSISQDFGEILAPILIMQPNDTVEFPAGNFPLIDVKLPGVNLSVKALSGSGTSFRSVSKLMDRFENEMDITDEEKKGLYNVLKEFHPTKGGSNKDKLIRAVQKARTNEYIKLIEILGVKDISSWDELRNLVDKKFKNTDYTTFLQTVYPMMLAGNWKKPTGLPADGNYYMSLSDKKPKEKSAGKPSYDVNPAKGGADIITYSLGVGLLYWITKGEDAEKYKQMMTDIVNKSDAVLGHITINNDGTMNLITRPFSDLKFEFQYHAPSHIPGNNLPGFIAILD